MKWDMHAQTMSARGRSAIRSLHLLGNSVHGLDFFNWRKVYHAIILPVLTFGFPIWSHRLPKSTLRHLQVAQNDAIRRIGGLFRTTPTEAAHHTLAIPPIKYTLAKYHCAYQLRLTRLPPLSKIRHITTVDRTAYYHPAYQPPTSLRDILPPSFPPFYLPSNTTWRHPCLYHPTLTVAKTADLMSTQPLNRTDILIYPIPHPSMKASAFLITQDGLVVNQGFHLSPDTVTTAINALVDAIQAVARTAPSHIHLFIHNEYARCCLFSLRKQKYLLEASRFTSIASVLLMDDDSSLSTHSFNVSLPGKKSKADP